MYFGFINILGVLTLGHNHLFAKPEDNENSISIDYLNKKENVDYILGEGDVIRIIISRDIPELSNNYPIDTSGTITIPKLKRIYVSGLTIQELTNLLNIELGKSVISPQIEVKIVGALT